MAIKKLLNSILIVCISIVVFSCGKQKTVPAEEIVENYIIDENGNFTSSVIITDDLNDEDNSWLIGYWEPIMDYPDPSGMFDYFRIELNILDENMLEITQISKLSAEGINLSRDIRRSKGIAQIPDAGNIKKSSERCTYTVDNKEKVFVFIDKDGYDNRVSFDKEKQILDMGSEQRHYYYEKKDKLSYSDEIYNAETTVEIIGIWQNEENEYSLPTIQFNDNGKAYYDVSVDCSANGTYIIEENIISFVGKLSCKNNSDKEYQETFTQKGNTLITKNGTVLTKRD